MDTFLLSGFVIGFSIAAPIGPIGVLCIKQTLAKGCAFGLVTGLGAATADAIYGCVAGLGLTFISNLLVSQQVWLRLLGGLFLCYLGIKILLENPLNKSALAKRDGLISTYASTFLLTLSNPMTILSFAAIFAGLGFSGTNGNIRSAGALVFGVFAGSGMWWLILSCCVSLFREKVDLRGLQWVNRVSGIIITAFGLFALSSFAKVIV